MREPTPILTGVDFGILVDFAQTHEKVRWVFSDIDGTLMHPNAATDLYVAAASSLGVEILRTDILPWLGQIPIQDLTAAASNIFRHTGASLDTVAAVIRQYEFDFRQASGEYFQRYLYPDILSSLTKLKELGVGFGIISNRYEEMAFRQIIGTEIAGYVNYHRHYMRTEKLAVCGGDTPSLEKGEWRDGKTGELEVHLHHLSISPEEAVVIGDRLDSDIAAAKTLGMSGIHIVRDSE